jgi:hypothetical protein
LEELKDSIRCCSDLQAEEIGLPPTRNGYFFIEECFYNDMRGLGAPPSVPPPPPPPIGPDFARERALFEKAKAEIIKIRDKHLGDPSTWERRHGSANPEEQPLPDPNFVETPEWLKDKPRAPGPRSAYPGGVPYVKPEGGVFDLPPDPRVQRPIHSWTGPIAAVDYSESIIAQQKKLDEEANGGPTPTVPGARDHVLEAFHSGAFYLTLVPIRPRRRGERRSLRTFLSWRISAPTPRFQSPTSAPFNSASDAFQLHPDVRSYGTALSRRRRVRQTPGRGEERGRGDRRGEKDWRRGGEESRGGADASVHRAGDARRDV